MPSTVPGTADSLAALIPPDTLWPLAAVAAVIWTIIAVNAHNRRAAALAAWQQSRPAAPTA
ncbi:MAG: hypothetical protein EXQ56_12895 [Acidobacteria bacterium]|nr:hypothetical protein [Acidobacteriota bacterium]